MQRLQGELAIARRMFDRITKLALYSGGDGRSGPGDTSNALHDFVQ